jgi:hypothetical protein
LTDVSDENDGWLRLAGEENLGAGRSYLPADITLGGFVDGLDFIDWMSDGIDLVAEQVEVGCIYGAFCEVTAGTFRIFLGQLLASSIAVGRLRKS